MENFMLFSQMIQLLHYAILSIAVLNNDQMCTHTMILYYAFVLQFCLNSSVIRQDS